MPPLKSHQAGADMKRRIRIAAVATALPLALLLASCGTSSQPSGPPAGASSNDWRTEVLAEAPVANPDSIPKDSSLWQAHQDGKLTYGGSKTLKLFSLLDPTTGELEGFDATMAMLLAKYLTGEPTVDVKIVTSETRESLISNRTIQAVVHAYSITPQREKKVDFAGPYFISGQAIIVREDNTDINELADLAGRKVCVTKGGTAFLTMQSKVPTADLITLESSTECELTLRQGRADAEVQDRAILLGQAAEGGLKLVGETITYEPYGIGLPNNSTAAVKFLNEWLTGLIKSGLWQQVYDHTIGEVKGAEAQVPVPGQDKTPDLDLAS